MFEKEAEEKLSEEDYKLAEEVIKPIYYNAIKNDYSFAKYGVECYLAGYNKANEWHKLDWEKDFPDVDKLVRVRTKSGAEYICETYSYFPSEDEIGYGSVITQFAELNGDWVDDNEIEYWCYIEPFKESE